MAETKLISPGIPNYTLKRNLRLNGNYISNDGGDEGIRIDDAGEIGLGIDNPTSIIHTAKASSGNHWKLTRNSVEVGYIGADSTGLLLAGDSGITDATIRVNNDGLDLDFIISGDDSEIFRTDGANHRVGIGNAAPGSLLEVSSTAAGTIANRPSIEISSYSDANDDLRSAGALIFQKVANDTINSFGADSHTAAGEVLGRIEAWGVTNDDDGSSDAAILSSYIEFAGDAVADETDAPGKITFATAAANDGGIPTVRMTLDDGGDLTLVRKLYLYDTGGEYISGDGTDLTITSGTDILLSPGGNVGIGVTDPDETLEVSGDVKLSGNLYLYDTGGEYISSNGTNLTLNSGADINLTCAASGDINIPADIGLTFGDDGEKIEGDGTNLVIESSGSLSLQGTSILFRGTNNFAAFTQSLSTFILYENGGASTDDYMLMTCSANGATSISTVDGGGTAADFDLDIDGDITLDSHTGVFIAKHANTEFSAANSAYAGMMLGYTEIFDPDAVSYQATTTSFVNLNANFDSADHYLKVAFVVPPSRNVKLTVHLPFCGGMDGTMQLALATDDSATSLHTDFQRQVWDVDESDIVGIVYSWYVDGTKLGMAGGTWAAGASKTIYAMVKEGTAGGRVYMGMGLSSAGAWTMEAIALPATIGDGT